MEMDLIQLVEQSIQLSDLKTFLCSLENKSASFLLCVKNKAKVKSLLHSTALGCSFSQPVGLAEYDVDYMLTRTQKFQHKREFK